MRRIHCDFSFDWAQETGDFEFKEEIYMSMTLKSTN